MGQPTDIRAWAKATIEAAGGVNVHSVRRVIRKTEQLQTYFQVDSEKDPDTDEPRLRGWQIELTERPAEEQPGRVVWTLQAECFWTVESGGDTRIAFDEHLVTVANALGTDITPEDVPGVWAVSTVDITNIEEAELSGRVVHLGVLTQRLYLNETLRS